MGSITLPDKMAGAVTRPPELSDAEYVRAVLKQPTSRTEDEMEKELLAEAQRLGIDISAPETRPSTPSDIPMLPGPETAVASPAHHARAGSNASNVSESTAHSVFHLPSSPSFLADTPPNTIARKRSKSLSFSQYEKYLNEVDPNLNQPRFLPQSSNRAETATIFSESTRRSVKIIKRGLTQKLKWRRKTISHSAPTMSCICCREDFDSAQHHNPLQTLPCGHTYCQSCLAVMITQSTTDEQKMPPRCCTQPIPGPTIKSVLARDDQQRFLKAVLQYGTPWSSRIFCPACGDFIPPRPRIDPRRPFDVVCRACRRSACVLCKRGSHRVGQDCPGDWELDAVLRMGERSGWRRCYKCRTLVELAQGCTHMTCRCKAQFCYICGAVWDPVVGCPNYCNGEEELERRRVEEEVREAEVEAEERVREEEERREERERAEADGRTAESEECGVLGGRQKGQMEEFRRFEHKMRWIMWTRHSQKRLGIIERYKDQMEKMRDRHAKTEQHLEDRQIEAEIELRSSLEQSERSIRIQLKYMEAYCNGLGRYGDKEMELPEREVTRKHREQLTQQYRLRDGMERRHQSHINVLREKQAKRMEELVERHEKEMEVMMDKRSEEFEDLGLEFTNEEEALVKVFAERRARMQRRWAVEGEILRKELEKRDGLKYGPLALPEWPSDSEDGTLTTVSEEIE